MATPITIPAFQTLIDSIAIRKRRPLLGWGKSGVGKTEAVEQAAKKHGALLCDIRLSQYESVDFRGIPSIESGMAQWSIPATIPFKGNKNFMHHEGLILLVLDEINQGTPGTMSVAYQLLNTFRVGEHELMDNVRIIGMGNRDQDKGVTNRFPAPLANRATNVDVDTDIDSWTQWAVHNNQHPGMIGFLNFRPTLLHTFDPKSAEKAWASPRTWSFVSEDLFDPLMGKGEKQNAICGSVGDGPGSEMLAFIAMMDMLPSIQSILNDPKGVDIKGTEPEKRTHLQWALATLVSGHMHEDSNLVKIQDFLERLDPEMVVVAWAMAIKRNEDLMDTSVFLTRYAPTYRAVFRH